MRRARRPISPGVVSRSSCQEPEDVSVCAVGDSEETWKVGGHGDGGCGGYGGYWAAARLKTWHWQRAAQSETRITNPRLGLVVEFGERLEGALVVSGGHDGGEGTTVGLAVSLVVVVVVVVVGGGGGRWW